MNEYKLTWSSWFNVKLIPGYQIASGKSNDNPYGCGSLQLQLPLFCQQGLPFESLFAGTLNLDLGSATFRWSKPWKAITELQWHRDFPAESFLFSPCEITHSGQRYSAFIYYPDPATKIGHFQSSNTIEVISTFIPGLNYGDTIKVRVPLDYIEVAGVQHG
ncbi:hypothetical protein [Thalassotalea sp. PS06]|uniref:hypothetical protein n=1 Tax=Thalassotalea sp. PS06 TaxID=2594005 RepID=UPI001163603C|nr:hypothetical protein [Thalassotalea sp. PS06]QDP01336.1 hypothetical protein FNC98_08305 [Thalassotalea sp. PS06]